MNIRLVLVFMFALSCLTAADTTPPTQPGTPTLVRAGSDRLALTWLASTDASQAIRYEIRRNGAAVGSSATTQYIATGLAASTAYTWTVVGIDPAGNRSTVSPGLSASTKPAGTVPTVRLSTPTTLGSGDLAHEGKALIVDGTILTISGTHVFTDLHLINGAQLTHAPATPSSEPRCDLTVLRETWVDALSRINLDGQGYRSGYTRGNAPTHQAGISYRSGSHGGYGRRGAGTQIEVYGDARLPDDFGSGGGQNTGAGHGGGRLRLRTHRLQLDGAITANGISAASTGSGAGGSVLLDVGELAVLAGLGRVQASGGTYAGGGRLACYFRSGGIGAAQLASHGLAGGGAGSIVLQDHDVHMPTFIFDNAGAGQASDAPNTPWWIGDRNDPASAPTEFMLDLTLLGNARVDFQSLTTLYFNNPVIMRGLNGFLTLLSAVLGGGLEIDGVTLVADNISGTTLRMINGARLRSHITTPTQVHALKAVFPTGIYIDATSAVDVSGCGYRGGYGAGNQPHPTTTRATTFCGPSHGGHGWYGTARQLMPYGNSEYPTEPGAGSYRGAAGGGLAKIYTDALQLYGRILANGESIEYGSGSGGSILIQAHQITMGPTAGIMALGGNYAGGGRIAIHHWGSDVPTGRISAASKKMGGCGTILIRDHARLSELWRFDNSGVVCEAPDTIWSLGNSGEPSNAPMEIAAQIELTGNARVVLDSSTRIRMPSPATWSGTQSYIRLDSLVADAGLTVVDAHVDLDRLTAVRVALEGFARLGSKETTVETMHSLVMQVQESIYVGPDAAIDVSNRGYRSGYGGGNQPHPYTRSPSGYRSGSYGGYGYKASDPQVPIYGDPIYPNEPGSGCGGQSSAPGGGLVHVFADSLQVDGRIQANGLSGKYSSGAGGGILINVRSCILGAASIIEALGGSLAGGGRIALHHDTGDAPSIRLSCRSIGTGGVGTIFIRNRTIAQDLWRFQGNGMGPASGIPDTPWWFGVRGIPATVPPEAIVRVELGGKANVACESATRLKLPVATTWNDAGTNLRAAEIIAMNGLTLAGASLTVDNFSGAALTVRSPSVLTCYPTSITQVHALRITLTGTVTIDAGGSIDVSGRGYLGGRGGGNIAHNATTTFRSGSHGGHGSRGGGAQIPIYGDPLNPNQPGAGGGQDGTGVGGGLLRIVANKLVHNGAIRANGASVGGNSGAGGGILIDVRECKMGNVCLIEALGAGNAGGGRIAMYYRTGTLLSTRCSARSLSGGGCGTILIRDRDLTHDRWRFHNGNVALHADVPPTPWWFGIRSDPGSAPAELTAEVELGGKARVNLESPTKLRLPAATTWTDAGTELVLTRGVDATLGLTLSGPTLVTDSVSGSSLALTANASVRGLPAAAGQLRGLSVNVTGALSVAAGSTLDATACGYPGGFSQGFANVSATTANRGGSHGGPGAPAGGVPIATYGDFVLPVEAGAGGGTLSSGRGGGRLHVQADRLNLAGSLQANAQTTPRDGAGGSVLVHVYELTLPSSGSISASGAGAGGGGRVALHYADLVGDIDEARLSAYAASGTGGTILLRHTRGRWGRLIIDANKNAGSTPLRRDGALLPFFVDLLLRPSAGVQVMTPAPFDRDGDGWSDWDELARGNNPDLASSTGGPILTDPDGDGVLNAREIRQGTDPLVADTDGDGVADGLDAEPLDPGVWANPPPG